MDMQHRQVSQPASTESDIAVIDDELAVAVAAAVAQRRAGQPADAEMRRLEDVTRRRKSLFLRHSRAAG